jgi:hypothetical protein
MTRATWKYKKPPYILHIQAAAHAFSPMSLAPIALKRLDVKRKLAARYGVAPSGSSSPSPIIAACGTKAWISSGAVARRLRLTIA